MRLKLSSFYINLWRALKPANSFVPVLTILLIIPACKKEENFSSRVSFVNAAISNPSTTLKADSEAFINHVRYDSLINTTTPSGTFNISWFSNDTSRLSFLTNLESGQQYLSMVYEDSNSNKGLLMRKDALPATPTDGKCSIRIFNAIARSPVAGLYLSNDTARQRQVISSLTYGNFLSGATFKEIDTITNGSIRIDSPKVVTLLPRPLLPGKIYTLYIIGRISDTLTGTRKPKVIMQVHN